jgi:magnesium-transporting ATPase (P-type)
VGLPSALGGAAAGSANAHWQAAYQRSGVLEFSRERKMMSVAVTGEGRQLMFTKGAPESVLARCTQVRRRCRRRRGAVALALLCARAAMQGPCPTPYLTVLQSAVLTCTQHRRR